MADTRTRFSRCGWLAAAVATAVAGCAQPDRFFRHPAVVGRPRTQTAVVVKAELPFHTLVRVLAIDGQAMDPAPDAVDHTEAFELPPGEHELLLTQMWSNFFEGWISEPSTFRVLLAAGGQYVLWGDYAGALGPRPRLSLADDYCLTDLCGQAFEGRAAGAEARGEVQAKLDEFWAFRDRSR
jgi:hypothetical protein